MNDKILHLPAAKLADVCGNGFGTKMHIGTLASYNEDLGITYKSLLAGYAMKTTAGKECYKKRSKNLAFIVWVHGLGEKKVPSSDKMAVPPS